MMKTKKLWALICSGVLSLGALAGCGGGGGNDPFDSGAKPVEGKYNLTIACQDEDGEKEILNVLKKAYEKKNPNVNVIIKDFGGDLFTNYMAKYATNQSKLPDVIWMPDDQFAAFAKGGYFLDLRSYYEADASTDYSLYYETMLHTASYTGEFRPTTSYTGSYVAETASTEKSDSADHGLYYAPRDYNKIGIVYNTRLFKQFKIDVPTQNEDGTWENTSNGKWDMEALIDLTQNIATAIEGKGAAFAGYRALNLFLQWEPIYTTIFKAMGSEGLIGTDAFLVDNEKNKEICDTLYNELFSSKIAIDRNSNFINGTTFMGVVVRPTAYTYSMSLKNEDGSTMIDFLPFPAEEIGAGCSGYGILKTHANDEQEIGGVKKLTKDLAWDFIKFVISEEGQEATGELGFTQPILKSLEKNGTWTKAISPDLNHSAWVAGKELRLTSYNHFDPSKRTTLRNIVQAYFQNLSDQQEGAPEKREALIKTYTDDFKNKLAN